MLTLPENRIARQALQRLGQALARRRPFPPLYLHGPPGVGKSALFRDAIDAWTSERPGLTVRIVPAGDLPGLLLPSPETESEGSEPPGRKELVRCDVLILEDVQHVPEMLAESLCTILDRRMTRGRPSVASSLVGPAELGLSHRFTSRWSAGLVVGVLPLSGPSRRLLAEAECRARSLYVTDEVLDWLARDATGGARPILGEITRLETLAGQYAPPLTMRHVRGELEPQPTAGLGMDAIINAVAKRYAITPKQLVGASRLGKVRRPRQIAMWLSRRLTGFSFARIGKHFGKRDHTTVMHACTVIDAEAAADPGLEADLGRLRSELLPFEGDA